MKETQGKDFQLAIDKVRNADSILVALSKNPTVDEMAAALGLTMALDNIGKHATAIYSGKTPNVLEFLEPEKTFEANTNSLQDFIIALSKDKADHLQYKIEGDYVKVYITPYKTTLSEDDFEFSHGDYNVDLIISINVPAAEDLDAALTEYGRIMHDATSVNITNSVPGQFSEVEWCDITASSVSEMVMKVIDDLQPDDRPISQEVATALLTGLVAATERFSNEKTTPEAMTLSSRLMGAGADQQLIASKMAEANEAEDAPAEPVVTAEAVPSESASNTEAISAEAELEKMLAENNNNDTPISAPGVVPIVPVEPEPIAAPVPVVDISQMSGAVEMPEIEAPTGPIIEAANEVVIEPPTEAPKDYSQQIEAELAEPLPTVQNPAVAAAPVLPTPEMNTLTEPAVPVMPPTEVVVPEVPVMPLEEAAAQINAAVQAEETTQSDAVELMPQVVPGVEPIAEEKKEEAPEINPVIIQPETPSGTVDPNTFKIPGL